MKISDLEVLTYTAPREKTEGRLTVAVNGRVGKSLVVEDGKLTGEIPLTMDDECIYFEGELLAELKNVPSYMDKSFHDAKLLKSLDELYCYNHVSADGGKAKRWVPALKVGYYTMVSDLPVKYVISSNTVPASATWCFSGDILSVLSPWEWEMTNRGVIVRRSNPVTHLQIDSSQVPSGVKGPLTVTEDGSVWAGETNPVRVEGYCVKDSTFGYGLTSIAVGLHSDVTELVLGEGLDITEMIGVEVDENSMVRVDGRGVGQLEDGILYVHGDLNLLRRADALGGSRLQTIPQFKKRRTTSCKLYD